MHKKTVGWTMDRGTQRFDKPCIIADADIGYRFDPTRIYRCLHLRNMVAYLFMNRNVRAILLDFDGVIVDSEPLIFEATYQLFAERGHHLERSDIQGGIGAGSKYVLLAMQKFGYDPDRLQEFVDYRDTLYRGVASRRLRPFADLFTFVETMRLYRFHVAVVSSAPTDVVLYSMVMAGIDALLFDLVMDGSSVTRKKPAPDLYLAAAKQLGVAPKQCLAVEDAPVGITSAHRAGMKVVGVTNSFPAERLEEADRIVRCLSELQSLILSEATLHS